MSEDWYKTSYVSTNVSSSFIYSNGLHCVTLYVSIAAANASNQIIVVNQNDLLASITVTDYDDYFSEFVEIEKAEDIDPNKSGWFFIKEYSNDFIDEQDQGQPDSQPVKVTILANGMQPSNKNIGIILNRTDTNPNLENLVFSANNNSSGSPFGNISVRPKKTYRRSDLVVSPVPTGGDITGKVGDNYTNYYVSIADSNNFFIARADILGPGYKMDKYWVAYKCYWGGNLRCIYIWPLGPQSVKTELGWGPYVNAIVNDRPGTLTITRTWQKNENAWYYNDAESDYECVFKLYDQYGNYGTFRNKDETGLYGPEQSGNPWVDPYKHKDFWDVVIEDA